MEETLNRNQKFIRQSTLQLGVILALVHVVAIFTGWYHTYPWIDIPQHFFGGALAGLIFYWIASYSRDTLNLTRNKIFTLLLVLSWTAFLGVLFEFAEFSYDWIFIDYLGKSILPSQLSLADTMGDLFFDLVGGMSLAVWMRLRYDRRKRQL